MPQPALEHVEPARMSAQRRLPAADCIVSQPRQGFRQVGPLVRPNRDIAKVRQTAVR